jgi:hypothetical protein
MTPFIPGYHNDIHQAVWKRPMTLGAPRLWSNVWLALCLYTALLVVFLLGLRWLLLPAVCWAIGQGVLVLLTQWDAQWDDVLIAYLSRKYHLFYDAG